MEYSALELKTIYNDSLNKKLLIEELNDIKYALELICPIIEYDEFVLQDIIDTLKEFKEFNIIENVNNETINLLRQIVYGNKKDIFDNDNNIYFNKYLRNLILPYDKNKCIKEYDMQYFLGEFDVFINLIRDNCNLEDYKIIYKYNKDLYEITGRLYKIMHDFEKMDIFIYGSLKDKLSINGIISHLGTLLYLSLDKFNYQYDLLNDTSDDIINNIIDFYMVCDNIKIFQDLIPIDDNETLREYTYALELLEKNYNKKNKRRKI